MDLPVDFSCLKNQKNVAVGLSGGGDSMALVHMLNQWAATNGARIHALTVDHNLRDNSHDEAQSVGAIIKNFENTTHSILQWDDGKNEKTSLMEKARAARYDLMIEYCKTHNIKTLCIAHHADDQLETFLFRLAKGSGLDGLAAMPQMMKRDGVEIFRPLLTRTHQELITYCKGHNLEWIEDPSNQNTDYARPRIRQALADEGLNAKRITNTIRRLNEAKDAIKWMSDNAMDQIVDPDGYVRWDILQIYPKSVIVRCLNQLLIARNNKNYPPKLERIEEIIATIQPSKSATLHGCLITLSKDRKRLEITKVES